MNDSPPPLPAPRGSRWVWLIGIVFAIGLVALIVLAVGVGTLKRKVESRLAAKRGLEQLQKDMVADSREAMESENPITGSADRADKYQQRLGEMADNLSSGEREVVLAGQAVLAQLKPELERYEAAYTKLAGAGAHSAVGIEKPEDITARKAIVEEFGAANTALAARFSESKAIFRGELTHRKVPTRMLDQAVAGFEKSAQVPVVMRVRELDTQLVEAMQGSLDLLAREWGHWEVDKEGQLVFESNEAAEAYNGLQESIGKIAEEQTALQRKIAESAAARTGAQGTAAP